MTTARISFDPEIIKAFNPLLKKKGLTALRDDLIRVLRGMGNGTANDTIDRMCGHFLIERVLDETVIATAIRPTIHEVGPEHGDAGGIYTVLRFATNDDADRFCKVLTDRI